MRMRTIRPTSITAVTKEKDLVEGRHYTATVSDKIPTSIENVKWPGISHEMISVRGKKIKVECVKKFNQCTGRSALVLEWRTDRFWYWPIRWLVDIEEVQDD